LLKIALSSELKLWVSGELGNFLTDLENSILPSSKEKNWDTGKRSNLDCLAYNILLCSRSH